MAVLKLQRPLSGYVIVAFPGLGFVGTIAGRYIVEKLSLPWSGYVHDERFPPVGKVRNGKLLYPVNVFGNGNVSVVLSETVLSEDVVWDVSRAIVARAKKDGARVIIAVSGVLIGDTESVYGITTGNTARKLAETFGIKSIENGVVTGFSAAILLTAREAGVPALLLLGPATDQQDFGAATKVVLALSRILQTDIPTAELEELAHRYEHEARLLQRRIEQTTPMYG